MTTRTKETSASSTWVKEELDIELELMVLQDSDYIIYQDGDNVETTSYDKPRTEVLPLSSSRTLDA